MGFKSVMKKIGKVALKVAPYAAMAIPGVGIPLSMAIQGGIGAAQAKASGAGWKGALIGGGLGAAGGAVGAGALKGIGPSSSVLSKLGAGAAGKTAGTGLTGKLGGVLGQMGANALNRPSLVDPNAATGGKGLKNIANTAINDASRYLTNQRNSGQSNYQPNYQSNGSSNGLGPSQAVSRSAAAVMPRGGYNYNDNPMNQLDQSSPNLAQSIFQGKQEAIRNQPFRSGYDVTTNIGDPDPTTGVQKTRVNKIPPIYSSNNGGGRRRQQQSAAAY